MPLRPAEGGSIARQLVLLFTLAAAVLLCSGLGVLYWFVVRHAHEEDNEVLADKISAVRADLRNAGGPEMLKEELKILSAGQRIAYWVRAVDAAGTIVAETSGMTALLPVDSFPAVDFSQQNGDTAELRRGDKTFALAVAAEELSGRNYLIQVAQDRSEDEQFTRKFGWLLGGVLACGIAAAALIATTVARRGLRPLADMTRAFERIGPEHLHEREPPTRWPRELQPLARAFVGMLDRLGNSFTRLSQFSADLAHELRTPVANLRGEAEVALTRPRSSHEYRAVIESSVVECERLSGIIDNLLFLARAEAADGAIQPGTFEGRAALEKITAYYQTIAEERNVTITCSGKGTVFGDPVLFGRAVSNLIENALRFTPDKGQIKVSTMRLNGAAEIIVEDNGSGISAEHLPRIFDRFYRADASRSSAGTGLGLSLVKSIMDLHRGKVSARSELGQGTVVALTFPDSPDGKKTR